MRRRILCPLLLLLLVVPARIQAAPSDWLSAPKPKFPPSSLRKGSEGSVKLKLVFAHDGSVRSAKVLKPSGDPVLDRTAQDAVLKWKLKPGAITAADLTRGRVEEIEFRQEALLAAAYPDRRAYFSSWEHTEIWMSAPFPSYPYDQRRLRHTGRVILYGRVADDGRVTDIAVLQSSGYSALDQCAVAALRLWRAHKQYAGFRFKIPIDFKIGGR